MTKPGKPALPRSEGNLKYYVLLHALLLLYSIYALLCKFASAEPLLSLPFLLFYGGALAVLGVYALFWQTVLKHMPLNTAFSNKAVVVIWGMLWGAVFFAEHITIGKIAGAALVMAGIFLVVRDER